MTIRFALWVLWSKFWRQGLHLRPSGGNLGDRVRTFGPLVVMLAIGFALWPSGVPLPRTLCSKLACLAPKPRTLCSKLACLVPKPQTLCSKLACLVPKPRTLCSKLACLVPKPRTLCSKFACLVPQPRTLCRSARLVHNRSKSANPITLFPNAPKREPLCVRVLRTVATQML